MLLNLDAGELPTETEELWRLADVLAIACGGHAGDAVSMARISSFCLRTGRAIGAHPSYPDRDGFGRRTIAIAHAALAAAIEAQCAALAAEAGRDISATAKSAHRLVHYVKPHGALYHDAARDPALATIVIDAARRALGDIAVIGPPTGALATLARARGLRYLREGFADRRTRADGSLVPRSEPDALITDPAEAAARASALHDVDIVCVHADTPGSLAIARAVRAVLPR